MASSPKTSGPSRSMGKFETSPTVLRLRVQRKLTTHCGQRLHHHHHHHDRGRASDQQLPAGGGVVSRGKLAMERAVKGTLGGNIMNAFAIGGGRPVSYSTV